jgi:hypothetical protein
MYKEREEILKKIKDAQELLVRFNAQDYDDLFQIKKLEEYTNEEKIQFFDRLYMGALSDFKKREESGFDIDEHFVWENVMEILSRDKREFWNSLG